MWSEVCSAKASRATDHGEMRTMDCGTSSRVRVRVGVGVGVGVRVNLCDEQ